MGQARGAALAPPPNETAQAALELRQVSARYPGGSGDAVSGVDLRVGPGEVVALLGANGAGKSTLLRVAAGLLAPDRGEVVMGGRDARTMSLRELSRQVAFVPQSEAPAWGFRVREVVAMGRAPHQGAWMGESEPDRATVDDVVERCDLAGLADRVVDTLSGGEHRRVALARALAQDPRVLLLDEPAAFLDVRHRLDLHDLLGEVVARRRIACLVATHDLEAASRLAARVVLMRSGRVLAAGAPDEVLTPERMGDAFGVQVHTGVHPATAQRYFLAGR